MSPVDKHGNVMSIGMCTAWSCVPHCTSHVIAAYSDLHKGGGSTNTLFIAYVKSAIALLFSMIQHHQVEQKEGSACPFLTRPSISF
jgi:hypothetical protein